MAGWRGDGEKKAEAEGEEGKEGKDTEGEGEEEEREEVEVALLDGVGERSGVCAVASAASYTLAMRCAMSCTDDALN